MGFADLAALLIGKPKFVSRRPQPFGHRLHDGRVHHPAFDVMPGLFTLLRRQPSATALSSASTKSRRSFRFARYFSAKGACISLIFCRCSAVRARFSADAWIRSKSASRREKPPANRAGGRFPGRFCPILDATLHLIALLGRQHFTDGFKLRLKQLAALSPQGLEFVREGGVGLPDLRALLGCQSELVGHGLAALNGLAQLLEARDSMAFVPGRGPSCPWRGTAPRK